MQDIEVVSDVLYARDIRSVPTYLSEVHCLYAFEVRNKQANNLKH